MKQISNQIFKEILNGFLEKSCATLGKDSSQYEVKQDIHRNKELFKKLWFVYIQNFNDLYAVKRINDDKYIRYSFFVGLTTANQSIQLLVTKWVPSLGSLDNGEVIFQDSIGSCDQKFEQLMIAALEMPVSNFLVRY